MIDWLQLHSMESEVASAIDELLREIQGNMASGPQGATTESDKSETDDLRKALADVRDSLGQEEVSDEPLDLDHFSIEFKTSTMTFPNQSLDSHSDSTFYLDGWGFFDAELRKTQLALVRLVLQTLQSRPDSAPKTVEFDDERQTVTVSGARYTLPERQYRVAKIIAVADGKHVTRKDMIDYEDRCQRPDQTIRAMPEQVRELIKTQQGVGTWWIGPTAKVVPK